MTAQHMLDFYTRPAEMTSGGGHAPMFDALPRDVAALARVVQGLLLHEHWAPAYGVALADERRSESHIRSTKRMLDHLLAHDGRPLSVGRPVEARLVGVCRHFAVLLAAMLRAKGIPARARCGFGAYFNPGHFEDHWVCEYWHAVEARWVLVDAQIDELQRAKLKADFDVLDVPRDRFVIAGDAWAQCRAGEADPSTFGIFTMRGLWFIAGNLMRDVAALNNMEMLPWDVWGAMIRPDEPLQNEQLALFDRLAAVTRAPDATFAELCALYEGDERLRVPATVFNSRLNRPETI
jgi:Transglutaminase-like superfamily